MGSVMDDDVTEDVQEEEAAGNGAQRQRALAWLVVAALVLALGVWGFVIRPQQRPSLDASLPPETPDPCSLVDRDELEAILGPIGEPREQPGMGAFPGQRACLIPRPNGPIPAAVVGLLGARNPISLRDEHPQLRGGLQAVEGMGDEAGWMRMFRVLVVAKDQWLLSVQMLEFEAPEITQDRAARVARAAVARL